MWREVLPEMEGKRNHYAVTVEDRTPEEIYDFCRNFKNFRYFMKNLLEIHFFSPQRSRWSVRLNSGLFREWSTKIIQDQPAAMISWQSSSSSQESTIVGSVWFSPAPVRRGTVISLSIDYALPGGKLVEFAESLAGEDPCSIAQLTLHRLKAYLETGEVPTIDGQSSGRSEEEKTTQSEMQH